MTGYTKKSLLKRADIAEKAGHEFSENSSYHNYLAAHRSYKEANNLRIWAEYGFLPGRPDDLWEP